MTKADAYLPQWGLRLTYAGGETAGVIPAADALAALRALLDANGQLDPTRIERLEIFRVRDIGGPEL